MSTAVSDKKLDSENDQNQTNDEEIISIGTFIQHLTYYLKLGIYVNKGTDKEKLLERSIRLYNRYKTIEAATEISEKDMAMVRKCLKRYNLILKVDDEGNPIDIRNKDNQVKMMLLKPHPALAEDDSYTMLKYARSHDITVLTEIPLTFMVRGKYNELLWQYTRSLFYISQYLLSRVNPSADPEHPITKAKKLASEEAINMLEVILEKITTIEEKIRIDHLLSVDKFLNIKLIKTGINEKNVNLARLEVKELFKRRGLNGDPSMDKMIDSISDKLSGADFSGGNVIESMFGIADVVAKEMKGDLQNNPDKFKKTLSSITQVIKDIMSDPSVEGEEIPEELMSVFNKISGIIPSDEDGEIKDLDETDIIKILDSIIEENSLDRDSFYKSIRDIEGGGINVDKLEDILKTVTSSKLGLQETDAEPSDDSNTSNAE